MQEINKRNKGKHWRTKKKLIPFQKEKENSYELKRYEHKNCNEFLGNCSKDCKSLH